MSRYRITSVPGRIAVLASGGLDSSVMLAQMAARRREVYPVYIRCGLLWEAEELATLCRFIESVSLKPVKSLTVLDVPMADVAGQHWSVTGANVPGFRASLSSNYIPGRNLTLLSKAAVFCARNRIGELAMAPLEANPFPDAQPAFFKALAHAIDLGVGLRLKIATPWVGKSKADVIRLGRGLPLELTVSCIRPRGTTHCGRCTKCAERMEGFAAAGIPDPTRYAASDRSRRASRPSTRISGRR